MTKQKKAAPTAGVNTAPNSTNSVQQAGVFRLSGSQREERLLLALLEKPHFREHLDRRAGASNSPDIVFRLRNRGLTIPCERVVLKDRDGNECRSGLYSLTDPDRQAIRAALKGGA
jgi:hypothetical protein